MTAHALATRLAAMFGGTGESTDQQIVRVAELLEPYVLAFNNPMAYFAITRPEVKASVERIAEALKSPSSDEINVTPTPPPTVDPPPAQPA